MKKIIEVSMKSEWPMILFVIFVVLKLCEVITWSWWWVTAPLWWWMPLVAMVMVGASVFRCIMALCRIIKGKRNAASND